MQQFTLSTTDGLHLGFMVFLPDNRHDPQPQSGTCMLRLQAADADGMQAARLLNPHDGAPLTWRIERETLHLYGADGGFLADIRQQYLRIGGAVFRLDDLQGSF